MQPGFIPRMASSSTPVLRPFTLALFPPSLTAFQLRFISIIFHIWCPGVPLLCVLIPLRQMLISVLRSAQLLLVQQISAADRSLVCVSSRPRMCVRAPADLHLCVQSEDFLSRCDMDAGVCCPWSSLTAFAYSLLETFCLFFFFVRSCMFTP